MTVYSNITVLCGSPSKAEVGHLPPGQHRTGRVNRPGPMRSKDVPNPGFSGRTIAMASTLLEMAYIFMERDLSRLSPIPGELANMTRKNATQGLG